MFRMYSYKKKGFTLLELLIVVIIIGILASLAIPRFLDATKKAKAAEAKSILGTIRSAQMRYYAEFNNVYTTIIGDLDISTTTSKYYTYSGANDAQGSSHIGQAAVIVGTGTGLVDNFRIKENGDIVTY